MEKNTLFIWEVALNWKVPQSMSFLKLEMIFLGRDLKEKTA